MHVLAAMLVHMLQRRPLDAGEVAVAPVHQGKDGRVQFHPFLGKPVFLAQRPFLVGHLGQYLRFDKALEAVGEDVAGHAEAALEVVETAHAEKAVAQYQQVSSSAARGQGLGHQLMERALQAAERLWLDTPVYLSAQAHLQAYYGRYGFVAVTEVYLEDDIPHIGMRRA